MFEVTRADNDEGLSAEAGKGHEPYQIVGAEKRPFDDRVEARKALALRRGRRAP